MGGGWRDDGCECACARVLPVNTPPPSCTPCLLPAQPPHRVQGQHDKDGRRPGPPPALGEVGKAEGRGRCRWWGRGGGRPLRRGRRPAAGHGTAGGCLGAWDGAQGGRGGRGRPVRGGGAGGGRQRRRERLRAWLLAWPVGERHCGVTFLRDAGGPGGRGPGAKAGLGVGVWVCVGVGWKTGREGGRQKTLPPLASTSDLEKKETISAREVHPLAVSKNPTPKHTHLDRRCDSLWVQCLGVTARASGWEGRRAAGEGRRAEGGLCVKDSGGAPRHAPGRGCPKGGE